MAESDYLPPVICEIVMRTEGFEKGTAQVRSQMASTATALDAEADKASQSTERIGVAAQRAARTTADANLKIVTSARQAGEAARVEALSMGKSAEEAAAAAGKAAEQFTVAQSKMTAAQKAAGLAAAEAAAAAKKSADEQEAAYARAAAAAEVEGEKISRSQRFLGQSLNNAGIAMGGALGRPLRGFGRQIEDTEHKARSFTGTLSEIGKVVTYGGILGFAGAAYEGVKAAQAYQTSIARIAADSGQRNAQQIGKEFLGTMGSSAFSAQELASSYAQVSQQLKVVEGSTLSAAQAMTVMRASSDLAKGAQTDLGSATQAVAQVMQAYHLGVGQASQASDALYSTARATNSSVSEIATSMGRLHSRLGAVTPSLRDVGGLMVGVAQTGLTGSRGILQVSSAMQTLLGGTTTVDNELARLHVGVTNASGGFVGMNSTISQLHRAFQGLSPQMQLFAADTIFGKGAAQVMLQVIDRGTASFQRDAQAADRAGAAHAAAAAQSKTLADQLEVVKSTIADITVSFGQIMIPVLEKVMSTVGAVVGWFAKNKAAAIALATVISGVLGAAIAVFVYGKLKDLVGGLREMGGDFIGAAAKVKGWAASLTEAEPSVTGIGAASEGTSAGISSLGVASETTTAKLTGLSTEVVATDGQIASLGATADGAGAQLSLFSGEVEAANGQLALFAADAEKVGGEIAVIGGEAGAAVTGVEAFTGAIGALAARLAAIAAPLTLAYTVFKGISQMWHTATAGSGLQAMLPTSTAARGLLGANAMGGRMSRSEFLRIQGGGPSHTTTITSSSPPWVQLGISRTEYEHRHVGPALTHLAATDTSNTLVRLQQRLSAQQKAVTALTEAHRVIGSYQYAAQDTGVAPLEQLLGIRGGAAGALARSAILAGGRPSPASLQQLAGGKAQAGYEREIAQMHKQGLDSLIPKLVAAHKAALDALSQQLVAQQALKDSASLTLESTSLTDRTKAAQDAATTEVAVIKDQQAISSAAMQAAAKNISDAAAVMSARMSAAATAITDATTVGQDRSAAIVQAMSDATKVQADILGERSLYGYQLVAQRLQVQLDATKAGFDKQIALQQEQVDETKQHWDGRIAAEQIVVARVTQHQDQLVAIAQQTELIAQMHADTLLGNAQQQSDTAQLAADMRVAMAQNAVTLSQSATPAQKQAAQNMLVLAQAQSGVQTSQAARALQDVTASTSLATTRAASAYQQAQDSASKNEAKTQAVLSRIQGEAQINEARSQQKLAVLNETMNKVVQKLQDQITLAQAGGGRRIRSDATNLAYTALGNLRRGGGGNVVMNLGPQATNIGIAQETRTERQYMSGKGVTINGGVHFHGANKTNDQVVNDMYLTFRALSTSPG